MNEQAIIRPNRNGVPAVRGTRLTVFSIMDNYLAGASVEEISGFYQISMDEANGALDYINSHITELMPTYREMLERDAKGSSLAANERFRQAHDKLMELKAQLQSPQGKAQNVAITG